MADLLNQLGLDEEDVTWEDLALCKGGTTEWWYDQYEKDEQVAKQADVLCSRCPVFAQCFLKGSQGEYGVWGGVYWNGAGKPDKNKNSHKSEDDWAEIHGKVKDYLHRRDS